MKQLQMGYDYGITHAIKKTEPLFNLKKQIQVQRCRHPAQRRAYRLCEANADAWIVFDLMKRVGKGLYEKRPL
ncbi:MAG: hypothetical protein CVU06_08205 [Bacteroidetes bacterium HGW-Bacteroidetes-22]|nr:MAG: hypothetical protein CVU06_08205 [Bacteroidetes bacterium HGW-Bacteroidetes-22]